MKSMAVGLLWISLPEDREVGGWKPTMLLEIPKPQPQPTMRFSPGPLGKKHLGPRRKSRLEVGGEDQFGIDQFCG